MRAGRHTAVSGLALIVAAASMTVSSAVWAEKVYKWVDAEGVTHYGEDVPKNTAATKVKVSDTTSSDAEDEIERLDKNRAAAKAAREQAEADEEPSSTPTKPAAPTTGSTNDDANKKACDMHRKNLAVLKTGKRVRVLDDAGKPRPLNEEERLAQIDLAENELKRCEKLEKIRAAREGSAKEE